MVYFHGESRKRSYFEGWYFKHQANGRTLALIPGVSLDAAGVRQAFIQVITDHEAHFIEYPFDAFQARKTPLGVRIGGSVFSERGVFLDIRTPEVELRGKLHYGELAPLEADIMGPFRYAPRMECRHGVVSMRHTLRGRLYFQGETWDFDGGTGYIEMDWGTSFPQTYLWTQCCAPEEDCSVMVSIADIPYMGRTFRGCIAAVRYRGRELRFGTYSGVKIRHYSAAGLRLQQGKYCLKVEMHLPGGLALKAPDRGGMSRQIRENASCTARYRLYEGYRMLFDFTSDCASCEVVE